ncbi:Non-hem dioxygenase N-terminal domain [Dillenia turbinata]|uniref:Non-hem dioxygenase N-terminal domain n=1 Tax=Dillenia turbinata TaxID=194707 RepID=A0AAN8UKD6_9MAGN
MAGVSTLPVLLAKRVQEMVLDEDDPAAPYLSRIDDPTRHVSPPLAQIPTIDLSLYSSPTSGSEEEKQELEKLRSALGSWGCFQAISHGIPTSFLNEVREVTREFFELPMEEKKKYAKTVEEFEGYGADPVPEDGQSLDWQDRLFLDVYPEDGIKLKFWPENPKSFRQVLKDFTSKIKKVTEQVSRAMARSLDLDENCFLDQFGPRGTLQARFNYYSRCKTPDLILGLKPHSDGTGFTIILQGTEVEGLQVLKDDQWQTVPPSSDALLVLMGDQMEIMSNGVFKSPVHRVLTSSEKERISIVVFYSPEPQKEIGPEEGLINEEMPRLFKKVADYANIHWGYYQQGKRALHAAKV